jgi:hypothetical protein
MKKLLIFTFSLLLTLTSFNAAAQMDSGEETVRYFSNRPIKKYSKAQNYTGSPYENEKFVLGNVYSGDKLLASNVALRYNAQRDELEVKSNLTSSDNTARVVIRSKDIYVKILDKTIVFVSNKENLRLPGYFILEFEGNNYTLYKKIKKQFVTGSEAATSITRAIPPTYKEKQIFFLEENSKAVITEFPSSKKGKLGVFGDSKKAMKKYASENKLNINKDYALIKLVKHFDGL